MDAESFWSGGFGVWCMKKQMDAEDGGGSDSSMTRLGKAHGDAMSAAVEVGKELSDVIAERDRLREAVKILRIAGDELAQCNRGIPRDAHRAYVEAWEKAVGQAVAAIVGCREVGDGR